MGQKSPVCGSTFCRFFKDGTHFYLWISWPLNTCRFPKNKDALQLPKKVYLWKMETSGMIYFSFNSWISTICSGYFTMGHFFHLPRISPSVPFWVGLPDWRVEMAHRRSDGGVGDSLFGCASNLLERMRVFHSCHCSRAFWAPCFRFPTDNPPFFLKVCDGSWKAVFFFGNFFPHQKLQQLRTFGVIKPKGMSPPPNPSHPRK